MLQKSIIITLFLLSINSCAERGESLNIPQKDVIITKKVSHDNLYPSLNVNASRLKNDTVANNVSGSILLLIGLIILL